MDDLDVGDHRGGVVCPPPAQSARLTDRHWRHALLVAIAGGVVRLCIAASSPLFPDETYYWEWSRHLAAGYFDHPPVIAWIIRVGTLLFGATPLGIRFGPVLAGLAGTLFLAATARRVAGDRAALLAALVFTVMPLSAAGLVLATPDAPLLAAAAAVVWAVVHALGREPRSRESLRWWVVAGAALGLAFASKYTSVLLPFGVVLSFVLRRDLRARLAEPGPYVAVLIALLVFAPVIAWNARHEWISFVFQLRHGFGGVRGSVVGRELELVGGQLGLVSPILFVMVAVAVVLAFRRPVSPVRPALAILAVAIFAFFTYSATKRRAEANWPALAYLPGVLLLVAHEGGRRWRAWLGGGIGLAGALTLVTYVNVYTPVLPVPARRDPAARAYGWDVLANRVRDAAAAGAAAGGRTWVAADRYQEASELAFLLPGHPETFALNMSGRANQYDLWPSFPDRAAPGDAMIVVLDAVAGEHPAIALLAPHFEDVQPGQDVTLARDGDPVKHMRMWALRGWRGTWPKAG